MSTFKASETEILVPIAFTLPPLAPDFSIDGDSFDAPPVSTAHLNKNGYWWELTLKAKTTGFSYKATFEIPVVALGRINPDYA